jgi:hypothetical protein
MTDKPSAGWYQRPLAPEQDRYWDGEQWTDDVRAHVPAIDHEPPPPVARTASAPVSAATVSAPASVSADPPRPAVTQAAPPQATDTRQQPTVPNYTAAASGAVQKALESDVVKQRQGELFVVGGSLLLLIGLITPWFHLDVNGTNVPGSSVNAFETRGIMYLVLIVLLATVAYVASRMGFGSTRARPINWRVLVGATGFNLALSLFCFVAIPGGKGVSAGAFSEKYTYSYGAFIGVAAAIAAFVGAMRVRKERKHEARRVATDLHPAG